MNTKRRIDRQANAGQVIFDTLKTLGMTPKLVTEDVLIRIFCNQKLIVVIGDMVGNGELNILVLDSSELGCSAREFIEKLGFLSNQIFYGCAMSIVQ
jgi:hypothetical protein